MANLAKRLNQLEERLRVVSPPLPRTPANSNPFSQTAVVQKPKTKFSDPKKFDGKNLTTYPQFKGIL